MDDPGGNDNPPVCEAYKKMLETFDFEGIAEHMSLACMDCAELALNFYAHGRELLFTDRLPSWLQKEKDEEEQRHAAEKAAEAERARIEQRAAKVVPKKGGPRNPEEIEEYIKELNMKPGLTDASLVWEIRKLKRVSEDEARAEVIKLRQQRNKIRKTERSAHEPPAKKQRTEEKVPHSEKTTPWLPHLLDYFPSKERSVLSDADQTRYINICSTLLFSGTSRFTGNKEELKSFDKTLEEERQKLDEMVVAMINPLSSGKFPVPPWMNNYCKNRARRRWISVYGMRFYNESIESVAWDDDIPQEIPVEQKREVKFEELLANGRMDRIRFPSIEKQLQLNTHTMDIEKKYSIACSNRFPIEEDKIALDFCLDKNISIAMDASTASHLMTRSFITKPFRPRYTVTVKTVIHEGTIRKIAFISKPKIAGVQYNTVFLKNFTKYAFKAMYVEKRREDQPFQPKPLKEIDNDTNAPQKLEAALTIVEDNDMGEGTSKQNDPLDNIMNSISKEDITTPGKTSTGKRYSIFKIGAQNVLIRSSAPLECHSNKLQMLNEKPITLDTVIELLPNVGASRMDPEEMLYSYCKKLFKVAEGHVFIRIGVESPRPQGKEWRDKTLKNNIGQIKFNVLQIHRLCFLNDVKSSEIEKHIMNMFSYRAHCFEGLLNLVSNLEPGYFLLFENQKRLHISKEKLETDGACINFEKQQLIKTDKHFPPFPSVFFGIDHRIFLQWQIYVHRAPGAFIAPDCPIAMALNRRGRTNAPNKPNKQNTEEYKQMRTRKNRAKKMNSRQEKPMEEEDEEDMEEEHMEIDQIASPAAKKTDEVVVEKPVEKEPKKISQEIVEKKDDKPAEGEENSEILSDISEFSGPLLEFDNTVLPLDTGELEIDIPDEE